VVHVLSVIFGIWFFNQPSSFVYEMITVLFFLPAAIYIAYIFSILKKQKNEIKSSQEVIIGEIQLAKKIQEEIIPSSKPVYYIYSLYKPMFAVGGDFYDFIKIPNTENIGIFISDVSGHGVSAALITSMIKTTLLQAAERINNPSELLLYINNVLQNHTAGNFITAFYGIYNSSNNTILYSNA